MSNQNIDAPKSLRYIVMSALSRMGEYTDKDVERFLIAATEYYSENINLFYNDSVDVAYIKTNGTTQYPLPSDFVDHIKVGAEVNGEMWVLGLNEHLVLPRKEACGDVIPIHNNGTLHAPSGGYLFSDHWHGDSFVSGLFGRGGGWNVAYYNIDKGARMLIVDGAVPKGEIILEYISSGVKKDGTTMVPLECVSSVREFVILMRMKFSKDYGQGAVRDQKMELMQAEANMERFITTPTKDEILDLFYESYSPTVNR